MGHAEQNYSVCSIGSVGTVVQCRLKGCVEGLCNMDKIILRFSFLINIAIAILFVILAIVFAFLNMPHSKYIQCTRSA